MLEIPEAAVIAGQADIRLRGRRIMRTQAGSSPHKFAWFSGEPGRYEEELPSKEVLSAGAAGGMVEIRLEGASLAFSDGVNLRLFEQGSKLPVKHQLLLEFDDSSTLTASVQMYGGLMLFRDGSCDNMYYTSSRVKPNPLTDAFDRKYFDGLFDRGSECLSVKAFLATGQRIPGLGNGVLQDILLEAGLHPKRKVGSLGEGERTALYSSIKGVLSLMFGSGGRDVEEDLFGRPGEYVTKAGRRTAGGPCPRCKEGTIMKESYLGGSVYFCSSCQRE